jgi:hypothetical protein
MPETTSSTTMATLAKLTSLSTQTLSLLLERQRLQSLSADGNGSTLHLPQITRNLNQLRTGVLDLEEKEGSTEAVRLLKSQYERMRGMLGSEAEAAGIPRLVFPELGVLILYGLTACNVQSTIDTTRNDGHEPSCVLVVSAAGKVTCIATRDTYRSYSSFRGRELCAVYR